MKGLRIGFIGTGGIARGHGKRLRMIEGVEIAALVDPSEESLAAFSEAVFNGNGRPPIYRGHREMLENEKLDAVLVCTPHTLHFDQIIESIDRRLFAPTPADTIVMPGHGDDTTIGSESGSLQDWVDRGW